MKPMGTTARRERIAASVTQARGALDVIDGLLDRGRLDEAHTKANVAIAEAENIQAELLEVGREAAEREPRGGI